MLRRWQMMKKNKRNLNKRRVFLPLFVASLGLGLGILFAEFTRSDLDVFKAEGILWPSPPKLNEFFLIDKDNLPFTLDDLKGRWSIMFFGFANCPDICPSTLMEISKAEKKLREIPEFGNSGQLIFISVDPKRDTPTILKTYVSHFSSRLQAASGSQEELQILAKSVGAIFLTVDSDSNNNSYSVDHSAGIFFVSPDATLFSVLTQPIVDTIILDRMNNVLKAYQAFNY